MSRAMLVCAVLVLCATAAHAQAPARPDGWVVIPVDEYRSLRLRAFPPERAPDPPPVDATITRVEYDLRVDGEAAVGEARLTVDVLKEGWVRVDVPGGLLVRGARLDGRPVPLIGGPPHVLLSKRGRAVVALDLVLPLTASGASRSLMLPPSPAAVSRLALLVARAGLDVGVSGGVIAERPSDAQGRWIAYGRTGEALTLVWKERTEDPRAALPLRWRGHVTQLVGLGEDTSAVTATIGVEVVQGRATSVTAAIPEGVAINSVSGPLVADWDFRDRVLRVEFLEPVPAGTSFSMSGETRLARDGAIAVPLVRLPSAERESGGVAVEVLGAGEIRGHDPRGLDPADVSDLGALVAGRESPSMLAFRYRPQAGSAPRMLTLTVARYTPQAVLVANVEEARYDALVDESGKTLVRARYAVRNNQRAFLNVALPQGATLWSAAVGGRPLRPGIGANGSLLLPLEKGRGGETPLFAVEVTYLQRTPAWEDKGRARLVLPAVDLPVARTGVALRHSPRYELEAERGAFHVETDSGPFSAVLRADSPAFLDVGPPPPRAPAATPPATSAPADTLIEQFRKESGGRTIAGPLPLRLPFPEFGHSLFLMSELTAESQAPAIEFSYKREKRW